MTDTKQATISVAERLSEEVTRLTNSLDAPESRRAAIGIAALLLAATVEAQLCSVSLETLTAILRGCWRETASSLEQVESAREHRKANDDGTSN